MRFILTILISVLFLTLGSIRVSASNKPKLVDAVRREYVQALSEPQLRALEHDPALRGLDAYSHLLSADELRDYSQSPGQALFVRPMRPDTWYLRIPLFHSRTTAQLQATLQTGTVPQALILDLRGNRGGLLNAAIEVADEFVDTGILASILGRSDSANLLFLAKPNGVLANTRVLVLMDANSASAAELLAGILRQSHSAILMGDTSTGKSAVQTLLPLDHGQQLSLTTAHYFFADGKTVPAKGLIPDIRLSRTWLKTTVPSWQSSSERLAEDRVLKRAMTVLWP